MNSSTSSKLSTRWNSVSVLRESSYFALLLMDSIWTSVCYYILARPNAPYWEVFGFFLASILISHSLSRFLNHSSIKEGYRRAAIFSWIVILLILSRQLLITSDGLLDLSAWIAAAGDVSIGEVNFAQFFRVLIPLIMYARSHHIARNNIDTIFYQSNFKLSLVILGTAGFFYDGYQPWIIISFFIFLAAGLIGSMSSRLYSLSSQTGGRIPPLIRIPIPTILSLVVTVLGIGILFGWLFGYYLDSVSQSILRTITSTVFIIIGIILSPILLGLLLLLEKLSLLIPEPVDIPTPAETGSQLLNELQELAGPVNPNIENIFDVGIMVILGSILLVILLGILLAVKWAPIRNVIRLEEDVRILNQQKGPQEGGRKNIFANFLGFRNLRRRYYASRIRAIYARLLDLTADLGIPRNPASTPFEYLLVMNAYFSGCEDEIKLITNSYVKVRYGELPESQDEFMVINNSWQKVKDFAHEKKNRK